MNMTAVEENINSVSGVVTAIHALRSRAQSGENVTDDLAEAISRVSLADCTDVSDAMSLLSLTHIISGMLANKLCQDADTEEGTFAVYIWAYLERAIGFLETVLKQHAVENGVSVN